MARGSAHHPDSALVVADGHVPARAALDTAWPGWAAGLDAGLVIGADGGALKAEGLGFAPTVVVGDGDSLPTSELRRLADGGAVVERASPDKDESDAELALLAAVDRGARRIVLLGALGGQRFDHALANVGLLAHERLVDAEVVLLDATTRVRLLRGPTSRELPGPIGDLVSLLPLGDGVEGVTTEGLRYPLRDEPLPAGPARGLSNVRVAPGARVSLRDGLLLIVETHAMEGVDT